MLKSNWRRQRELKKQSIPGHQEMISIMGRLDTLQEQALFAMAYLTGGRISELVETPFLRQNKYIWVDSLDKNGNKSKKVKRNENGSPLVEEVIRIPIDYPGILKCDVNYEKLKGKDLLIISMANRKNKNFTKKRVPIPIFHEKDFVLVINEYMKTLKDDEQLFPFKQWRAGVILAKIGMNPHFLRDIRLTHMVTIYGYNAFQLTKFAGWANVSPAERYVRLGLGDLVANF